MYPRAFDYRRAETLEEALVLLEEGAQPLAGGQSLIPLLKLRLVAPARLADIGRLDLGGSRRLPAGWRIGCLQRHAQLAAGAPVALLREAAAAIGDVQVRNWGTIGGSLCEADPAGDWAPALLAAGARVELASRSGRREVGLEELFRDPFTTCLQPGELLLAVRVPQPGPRSGGAYRKFERRAGDFAVAGVAVQVELDDRGRFEQVRIGCGALGPRPFRAGAAESVLVGEVMSSALARAAGEALAGEAEPLEDVRGSAAYRRRVGAALCERALAAAHRSAGCAT